MLDLGCGAGTDLLIAALMAGPSGRAIGIDMTTAMTERARQSAAEMGLDNVEVHEGLIDSPLPDESVDAVISNGVIDLVPDKDAVFSESSACSSPAAASDSRRGDPSPGVRGGEARHRPLDRVNCRSSPGRRAARQLVQLGFTDIKQGDLVDTYARSTFEDTRRKAEKFGAMGSTIRATKPR